MRNFTTIALISQMEMEVKESNQTHRLKSQRIIISKEVHNLRTKVKAKYYLQMSLISQCLNNR